MDTGRFRQSHLKSGSSLRRCRGLQLSSYPGKDSGLEDRSSPLSFSPFFPGRELRLWLCKDSRHEQGLGQSAGTEETGVSKNKKSAGTARVAAHKKKR